MEDRMRQIISHITCGFLIQLEIKYFELKNGKGGGVFHKVFWHYIGMAMGGLRSYLQWAIDLWCLVVITLLHSWPKELKARRDLKRAHELEG